MTMTRAREVEQLRDPSHASRGFAVKLVGMAGTVGMAGIVGMVGIVAALGGCLTACGPDSQGKFEEFVEQTRDTDGASDSMSSAPITSSDPGTTGTPTTTGDTDGPAPADISGDFLLAVSTVVDKSKPLQFIATNTVVMNMDGTQTLSLCLQPLSLEQGKVTVPRQPIGEPLCFTDLPIADTQFTIDAGTVMVTGMANPITGANITATLKMSGTVKDADFYCGTVTGEVLDPPIGSIDGSTFAAVRLADKTVLPTDVVINCAKMPTVTDPP
jgi:hypothetical protein